MAASFKTLFQLPEQGAPTWFENISIRPNGNLLLTRLDVPEVWQVDSSGAASLLLTIGENNKSLTGITPISRDVFAIGVCIFNMSSDNPGPVPGSCSMWLADLNGAEPKISKIAQTPEIALVNGITSGEDGKTVLVTDCGNGKLYKMDIQSGEYSIAIEHELMEPPVDAAMPYGINGIKLHREGDTAYLYWTNTARAGVYRVPVDANFKVAGSVDTVAANISCDDLVVTPDGTVYVCTNPTNSVVKVAGVGGEVTTLAGEPGSMAIAGSTACVLSADHKRLYVATAGGNVAPVNGQTEAAKVVEITLS